MLLKMMIIAVQNVFSLVIIYRAGQGPCIGSSLLVNCSGDASPLLMAGHRQVINRISKGSQDILIYNFILTTFDCQGGSLQGGDISARAFALARPDVAPPLLNCKPIHVQFPWLQNS